MGQGGPRATRGPRMTQGAPWGQGAQEAQAPWDGSRWLQCPGDPGGSMGLHQTKVPTSLTTQRGGQALRGSNCTIRVSEYAQQGSAGNVKHL